MSQVISSAWLCTAGLEKVSRNGAVLWCHRLWDLSLDKSWSVSKAITLLISTLGGLPGNLTAFLIHSLFWGNLNLCIFIPMSSNILNSSSPLPMLIHLLDLKKIILPFLCYLLYRSAWLKRTVSFSLCLKGRILIPLAVLVVSVMSLGSVISFLLPPTMQLVLYLPFL